jgi:hypothetical protein
LKKKEKEMAWNIFKNKKPFTNGESRFFDLLSRQSSKTVEGLEAL